MTPQPWPTRSARHRTAGTRRGRAAGWRMAGVGALCAVSVASAVALTGQTANGADQVSAAAARSAGSPAATTTSALEAPLDISAVVADARTSATDAATRAAEQAAAAASEPDPIDETDAGLVDPDLGSGAASPQWSNETLHEATRRLDELAAAGPDSPLMQCLQEHVYEDC